MLTYRLAVGMALAAALAIATPAPGQDKTQSPQQARKLDKEVKVHVTLDYLVFHPEGYAKADKPFPLIVFLHGAGEVGTNLDLVKKHGPPKIVETKKDFPFIVVSPQAPEFGWKPDVLNALLDEVLANNKVDPDRVYLTGLSMGGYGTWAWAAANPHHFAAIAPICGGGNPAQAERLKNLPTWVFHGAKDAVVPLKRSEEMVDAIKKAGGNPKFTVYPEANHDSWTATYDNPELYQWFLQHRRESRSGAQGR